MQLRKSKSDNRQPLRLYLNDYPCEKIARHFDEKNLSESALESPLL